MKIAQLIGQTPLVRLNRIPQAESCLGQIVLKLEGMNPTSSVKDRIALRMIQAAEAAGDIFPGQSVLVEATAGNTGIALAMAPEDIVVGAIVRDMEATLDIIDCAASKCPLIPACLLKPALDRAGQAFIDTLDGYTIADLTRNRAQIVKLVGFR